MSFYGTDMISRSGFVASGTLFPFAPLLFKDVFCTASISEGLYQVIR